MYSDGPPHMAEQKQDDQLEHTYSSYVRIRDVVHKTWRRRWTIGRSGERGSGISVLEARHDDYDDYYHTLYHSNFIYIYINGIGDLSSNIGRGYLHFTSCKYALGRCVHSLVLSLGNFLKSWTDWVLWPWFGNESMRRKALGSNQMYHFLKIDFFFVTSWRGWINSYIGLQLFHQYTLLITFWNLNLPASLFI